MWWSGAERSVVRRWRVGQDTPGFHHSERHSGEIFFPMGSLPVEEPQEEAGQGAEQAAHSHAGAAHRSISKLHSPIPQTFSQPQLPSWDVQPARLKEDGSKSGSDTARMRG